MRTLAPTYTCATDTHALSHTQLTLTGHISPVRGIAVSDRHPYMFTVGEDKLVKCWDLETNKVMRHYHGHLSGVYACALHPTLDVLCTGGRDSSVRVWDIRSKNQIFCLAGHKDTIGSIATQGVDPQIISGGAHWRRAHGGESDAAVRQRDSTKLL